MRLLVFVLLSGSFAIALLFGSWFRISDFVSPGQTVRAIRDDGRFADKMFSPVLNYEETLVSADSAFDDRLDPPCQVAVVRLPLTASTIPPVVPLIDRKPDRFGGNWRKTPERNVLATVPDPLVLCAALLPDDVREPLQNAMKRKGAFYIRNWRDGVLQIFSFDDQLAAYIRYDGP